MVFSRARILFVDDEPRVLHGIRNRLRAKRTTWDMIFVDSGSAALLELQRDHVAVVVTDMRMPGMTGAELLTRVATLHPQTRRIILSAEMGEFAVRALLLAHHMLAKPCEPELLEATIQRTLNASALCREPLGSEGWADGVYDRHGRLA
jgi:DNA-binding NarL/FixJ family response regulator